MNFRTLAYATCVPLLCASGSVAAEATDPVLRTALMNLQEQSQEKDTPLVVSVPLGGQIPIQLDGPEDAVAAVADSQELGIRALKLRRERVEGGTRFERLVLMSPQYAPGLYRVHVRITAGNGTVTYRTVLVDAYEEIGC